MDQLVLEAHQLVQMEQVLPAEVEVVSSGQTAGFVQQQEEIRVQEPPVFQ
jgi:hypothetical protein